MGQSCNVNISIGGEHSWDNVENIVLIFAKSEKTEGEVCLQRTTRDVIAAARIRPHPQEERRMCAGYTT